MGIFNGGKAEQIQFLDEEREKLWKRLTELENKFSTLEKEVNHRSSDSEKEAKEHSRKAAEFRNKTEERYNSASEFIRNFGTELEAVRKIKDEVNAYSVKVNDQRLQADEAKSRIDDVEIEYEKKVDNLNSKIDKIEEVFEKYPDIEETVSEVKNLIDAVEENEKKSEVTLTAINTRKKEIDDLHRKIFGYIGKQTDTASETKVQGLKDELDSAYKKLSDQISDAEENVTILNTNFEGKYNEFQEKHQSKYKTITEEISRLLPNALTAGLSAAFSKKKGEEEVSAGKLQNNFSTGIYLMIAVSIIPAIISIIFINQKIPLAEVINRLPRLVLAIIPMYIPVLWFTVSASKKLNLSKRLIEEYAHKEVLSKTYEGLATQISSINNTDQSEDLKYRLLASFLQVSSENPGKLISNYEASDHPVMEALEQSYKFQIALDKLEAIPGLGKVAAILEKKAKRKLDEKTEKIDGLLAAEKNLNEDNAEV